MNNTMKTIAAVGVAGALALAAATPSLAGGGRTAAAAAGGFAAGALIGSTVANSHYGYYGPHYASQPAYGARYGYGYDSYAYAPGPTNNAVTYPNGDYIVGYKLHSQLPIHRSELGPLCSFSMKQIDQC